MSLKDLFDKKADKIVSNSQLQQLYDQAESEGYLDQIVEDKNRFLPSVDFSKAENFARYGSAEKYYVDAIKNIYQRYPYDGSRKEKEEWKNNSSQFDLYVLDNVYPKTTGYVLLSGSNVVVSSNIRSSSLPQYISVFGGPNAGADNKFETGNIYDISKNRESNLGITQFGNTIEFWFKDSVESGSALSSAEYCLFDLWNGIASGSSDYTRLTIRKNYNLNENNFSVSYISGTSGLPLTTIDYNFDPYNWHHYAFTFKNDINNSSNLEVCLYVDGNLQIKEVYNSSGNIKLANNLGLKAYIGCYQADSSGVSTIYNTLGSSCGYYDEFRFWKECRSSQQIFRNWFDSVGGGSNTDDSNTELGIYFKFNEGIINTSAINEIDKIILDYSGRISNGNINNYSLTCRNTGSAIDEYFLSTKETKDPIIYSSNNLVVNILEEYSISGSIYDQENSSNIYKSLPSWIIEEAESKDLNDLSNLIQIISSYFDSLHIQIQSLPDIKSIKYDGSSDKPKPFINQILSSYGFEISDLFSEATFIEEILSKNENKNFDDKLSNVKNIIYQNIYNNLSHIYKSKGTEESLRNLIRCFGVDDELIKINLYANNSEFEIKDKFIYSSRPKKVINFNSPETYEATIFQNIISGDNTTIGYLPYSLKNSSIANVVSSSYPYIYNIPTTLEAEIIFPKKLTTEFTDYWLANFTEVSLFGIHTAEPFENDFTWGNEKYNFQVYAIKRELDSKDVYFKLTGSFDGYGVELTSSWYNDVYDDTKWNFAVRVHPVNLYEAYTVTGSDNKDYLLEFVGINSLLDTEQNSSFVLSASIPKTNAISSLQTNKRIYAGAHLNNFTEETLQKSDIKVSQVRYWLDYISNDELLMHSYDIENYGVKNATWVPHYLKSSPYSTIDDISGTVNTFTKADTLILNWNFSDITSSNNLGQFTINDFSSGSKQNNFNFAFDWLGYMSNQKFSGLGYNFPTNSTQVINKDYLHTAKLQFFENLNGNDLISIPATDDVTREKSSKPINYYISLEKSMSEVVNNEIINWFSTINEFNNLIGEPIERYKKEYSKLTNLRKLFYSRVSNTPDFEKFFDFYKWIDSSISQMIYQLLPFSSNSSDKVRNIVENTILQRNKYQNKLPTLEFKGEIVALAASNGIDFSYTLQNAPSSPAGSLWLKKRVARTTEGLVGDEYVNTPLEPQNDIDREKIRQVINYTNLYKAPTFYSDDTQNFYEGKKDILRIFNKPYKFLTDKLLVVENSIEPVDIIKSKSNTEFVFASASLTASGQIVQPVKKINTYNKTYEFLQGTGRITNNKSFTQLEGNVSGSSTIATVSGINLGFYDRTLPSRSLNESIIVERFSAPGSPEVLSRGALDEAAEEYSAYNSTNYRNYKVRKILNTWLAETSSIDSNNPSYHKVNKNVAKYPANASGSNINYQYDNEFVVHAIPRSDTGYTWIKASNENTNSFSGYSNDEYNSLDLSILSGNLKFIEYEIPITSLLPYSMSNSISSSTNYRGTLYDSGYTSNYGANEKYYFTVIPTSSNGQTYDTGINITYSLSSSISSSISGNLYSKMRVYFADDPTLLESGSFVFPDTWYAATAVNGGTEAPFYVSGCLDSMKINSPSIYPYVVEDPTTIHGMDISGSTIFVVGNFTQITSSVAGVTSVYGAFAYNYETKTYYDVFAGSSDGPYGSPHTASWWVPYDVLYTRFNEHDYLIFSHGSRNYSNRNQIYNGNNNAISIYNLTKKQWNTFANAKVNNDPYTYTQAGLKNIADSETGDKYRVGREIRFFTFDNLTQSNGDIGVINAFLRDDNGDTIYPDSYYGRNNERNITRFSIDPASPRFCVGSLYTQLSFRFPEDGITTTAPLVHTFVQNSSGYDLYVAGQDLSGNLNDDRAWTMIKINSDGSKTPVPHDSFYTIVRGTSPANQPIRNIRHATKIIASDSKIWMYGIGSQRSGSSSYDSSLAVSSYDTVTQTFSHVTGGVDTPVDGERNVYRAEESEGFFFLIGNYVYTVGEYFYKIDANNPKYLSSRLSKTTLLRYNTQYDTDNYFAPVVGNGELMGIDNSGDGSGENILFIGNINIGKNLPFSNPNHGKIFAPQPSYMYDVGKKLQFNFFNASKYNELTYPSRTFGSNITSSLEYTGSNFLVTWTSNNILASGFQLTWDKQTPTIINRQEFTNYLGIRSNASSDYYFTDLQLDIDLSSSLITFNNSSSYTASYGLNDYLLNLNGPYQHASWQQTRTAENKFNKYLKKLNYITVQDKPIIEIKINEDGTREEFIRNKGLTFTKYKEPVVTFNKPIKHNIIVTGSKDPVEIISSYDNNKKYFANNELSTRLELSEKSTFQAHDIFKNLENGQYTPKSEILNSTYEQIIYPKEKDITSIDIRYKDNYSEVSGFSNSGYDRNVANINTIWKDSIDDRLRTNAISASLINTISSSVNSLNIKDYRFITGSSVSNYSSSIRRSTSYRIFDNVKLSVTKSLVNNFDTVWPLDNTSSISYSVPSIILSTGGTSSIFINSSYASDLAGADDLFELVEYMKMPFSGSYKYVSKALEGTTTESTIEYFNYFDQYNLDSDITRHYITRPKPSLVNKIHLPATTAITETDISYTEYSSYLFINEGFAYKTNIIAGKNPWYNSYDEYFENIAPMSSKYSNVSEYKVSDHMDFFVKQNKGDFKVLITGSYLSLYGATKDFINLSSSNNNTEIVNTFIYDDVNKGNKLLTLKVNGIKKLLPYKGFYPSDRSLQIVDLFQKSFFGFEN